MPPSGFLSKGNTFLLLLSFSCCSVRTVFKGYRLLSSRKNTQRTRSSSSRRVLSPFVGALSLSLFIKSIRIQFKRFDSKSLLSLRNIFTKRGPGYLQWPRLCYCRTWQFLCKIDLLIRVEMSDWGGRGEGGGGREGGGVRVCVCVCVWVGGGGGGQRYGTDHPKLAFLRRSVTNLFSKGKILTETKRYARYKTSIGINK